MATFWWIAYLILALAIVQSVLLAVQTWENCRYARSCMRELQRYRPAGRAVVIAPCKGIDINFEENLGALFRQDYDDYEVRFVVESAADPAWGIIRRVMARHPERVSRLVIAGLAAGSGQKIHNLRAATAELSPEIKHLAFLDSDAQPRPEWLRLLIARLHWRNIGAITGYRWFVPTRPSLANCLLYGVNCGAMALLGRRSYHLIWGGSWAIRRDLFESLAVRQTWKGALSDDLVISELLRRVGLATRFEPVAVVASPVNHDWRQMFSFLRRQYMFGRYHVTIWWVLGLCGTTLANLGWLAGLGALGSGLFCGAPPLGISAGTCVVLYGVGVYRGMLRQSLVRSYCPSQEQALRVPRRFDIWAGPLVGLVNWLGMLGSMFGRRIRWRGIEYRVFRGGRIGGVCHEAVTAGSAAPLPADRQQPETCGY